MALTEAKEVRIRIATFVLGQDGGAPSVQPYQAGAIYPVDDVNPWLCVGFVENHKAYFVEKQKHGKLERYPDGPADGLHWWRWQPFAEDDRDLGRHRRYGHHRTELREPRRITLECYAWPGRFCDPIRYQTMLAEIEHEFDRPIEWERSDVPVRAHVVDRRGRPSDAELLSIIRDELRAANTLERTGALTDPAESSDLAMAAAASPELRLIAMWAWRRLADLLKMRRRQARLADAHRAAAADPNQARARQRGERFSMARRDEFETDQLAAQVSRIADRRRRDLSSFDLSPAMQRDHRLRRLVRAFAPATREHWAALQTLQLSTSPPLNAPDVFELWTVARLVRAATALGWTVRRRVIARETVLPREAPYLVELVKDDRVLALEHNPAILRLDCGAAPPMHVRRAALLEWASANIPAPDGLVAVADLTPDYTLRLSSADGEPLALAIGDATLSDPKHATEIKADKLLTYRERIGWHAGDRLIRCPPACTFVVLPGPASRWAGVAGLFSLESMAFFPDPGEDDDLDFTDRVGALIETMLGRPR